MPPNTEMTLAEADSIRLLYQSVVRVSGAQPYSRRMEVAMRFTVTPGTSPTAVTWFASCKAV